MKRILLLLVALYPSWIAMMAVHEMGHVLHAHLSGGTVSAVRLPLMGFSVTELSRNPRPRFVAWGGPIWGCLLPLGAWAAMRWRRWRGRKVAQFFAGFCLVSNGVYIGLGWGIRPGGVGDAADLLMDGTHPAILVGFGATAAIAGLYLWHRFGPIVPQVMRPKESGAGTRPAQ